eukprot:Plantae.Rhodophyta-Purpureofilum_apyrenoidigerum.ctg11547.p1 GENE.Plantae.Rhodophyta-Purpureofilum_apyrenoidigerum.ctg11547~~Plantae.Rhodophyta-Purpureofilum_apyrenoidigerum.ctg11547.p1  ORF type:complete len:470 (-),score=70.16 Plantae.Rhodophyta-Purpureofilum_apyrenoidigerum.ctg11547:55-1431(-)
MAQERLAIAVETPKMNFSVLPEAGWKWLMFTMDDVPGLSMEMLESAMAILGFHRVAPQILEVNGQVEGIISEKQMFAQLAYPLVITDDYVFGRVMSSLVGCLGSTVELGHCIEERFFILKDDKNHPKTLQSALFDSGFVAILDDCMESLLCTGEVGAFVFHPDKPFETFRPIFVRERVHCAMCQAAGTDCECNPEAFMKKGLYPKDEWSLLKPKRFANLWNRYKNFFSNQNMDSLATSVICTDTDAARFTSRVLQMSHRMRYCTYTSGAVVHSLIDKHIEQMSLKHFERLKITYLTPEDASSSGESGLRSRENSSSRGTEGMKIVQIASKAECHICGAKFSRKYEVRRHVTMVHEAVKNFICDICGRAFALKQHLTSHIDGVHNKKRDFLCESCGMAFSTEAKVNRHYRCVHLREREFHCNHCESSYFQQSDLARHIKKKHEDLAVLTGSIVPQMLQA